MGGDTMILRLSQKVNTKIKLGKLGEIPCQSACFVHTSG